MATTARPNGSATATEALTSLTEMQRASLSAMTWMGTSMVETSAAIWSEMLSFLAGRVREDVQAQHDMLHCKSLSELREIQTEFLRKAVDAYTAETGKIVELGSDLTTRAMNERP